MGRKIVWTPTARETYIYILEYLDEFWGQKYVNHFVARSNKIFKLVSLNPQLFENIYQGKDVRKGILHKNCSFLYRFTEDRVELLVFWDSRQEPFL